MPTAIHCRANRKERGNFNMKIRIESYKRPMFIVSVILIVTAILLGPYCVIRYLSCHETEGTVITQEFVENYIGKYRFEQLVASCGGALFFGVLGVVLAIDPGPARSYTKGVIGSLMWIFVSLLVVAIPICHNIPTVFYEPRVETVTVIDRHMIPSRHDNVYRLVYSNGAAGTVDQETYENVPDGTTYYVIMCGNYCSEEFRAGEYSLPEES